MTDRTSKTQLSGDLFTYCAARFATIALCAKDKGDTYIQRLAESAVEEMGRRVIDGTADETSRKPTRDADHCDYPDCESHWTNVVAQARALLEPLAECDPAIRQWLKTPNLPALKASAPQPFCNCGESGNIGECHGPKEAARWGYRCRADACKDSHQ